jgi:hypothetical protein
MKRAISGRETAGILLASCLIAFAFGLPRIRRWEQEAIAASAQATRQLARAEQLVRWQAKWDSRPTTESTSIASMATSRGDAQSVADARNGVLATIERVAAESGVHLISTDILRDSIVGVIGGIVGVRVSGSGDVRGLTKWIAGVESAVPRMRLRDFVVTQSDPGATDRQPEQLRIEAVVEAAVTGRMDTAVRPR